MSIMRNRKRVIAAPVLFVNVRRISIVPKVELFAGSDVKSRTRLGGEAAAAHGSISEAGTAAFR